MQELTVKPYRDQDANFTLGYAIIRCLRRVIHWRDRAVVVLALCIIHFAIFAAASSTEMSNGALGKSVTLDTELQAQSLHVGDIDMVIYFLSHADHYEVVATYASVNHMNNPGRFRMALQDLDRVSFGAPGLPHVLYTFSRSGETVTVQAERSESIWSD